MLLDYALKIRAEESYQAVIVAMSPHISKQDRKQLLNSYRNMIDDNDDIDRSAIIERDRQRLRALLSRK